MTPVRLSAFSGRGFVVSGSIIWLAIATASTLYFQQLGIIEVLFLLAPLVTVPLGLRLVQRNFSAEAAGLLQAALSILGPFAALLVLVSFLMRAGGAAAALCALWFLFAGLTALAAIWRILRRMTRGIDQFSFLAAQLYLPVGAAWLILSRAGATPMGFAEPIVLLTAVHFHFAGFAAPILAGETVRRANQLGPTRALLKIATAGIILAPALIAAGFVVSKTLQLFGVFLSSLSLILLSACMFWLVPRVAGKSVKILLLVSAGAVPVGMAFAVVYAVGMFHDQLFVSIPHMAAFHGVLNGVGFTLCGLLAWNLRAQAEAKAQ